MQTLQLLLPALLPSWRFFDWIAPSPRIEFSVGDDVWVEFQPRPQSLSLSQSITRLFWNPQWNDFLFTSSCAERLMQNPKEHSERQIIAMIQKYHRITKPFQFRLMFITRDHKQITYISDTHHDI